MITWLPGAHVHDLHPAIGNGPFEQFLGVALHVNVDEYGTPDSFWGNGNPGQVCPNFQVYKDGSIHQMLPLNWQPWCQMDGNFNYAAIETAGMPTEPLTDAQLASIAKIVRAYQDNLGMALVVTDTPGHRGLITHQAGGAAWGGHSCPGTIRAGQRSQIIALAQGANPEEFTMDAAATKAFADLNARISTIERMISSTYAQDKANFNQMIAKFGLTFRGDPTHPDSLKALHDDLGKLIAALPKDGA